MKMEIYSPAIKTCFPRFVDEGHFDERTEYTARFVKDSFFELRAGYWGRLINPSLLEINRYDDDRIFITFPTDGEYYIDEVIIDLKRWKIKGWQ